MQIKRLLVVSVMLFSLGFAVYGSIQQEHYYLGNNAVNCGTCHTETVNHWQQTQHASAQDSLAAVPYFGFSCLPCHNTGWNTEVQNFGADEYVEEGENNAYTITDEANFELVSNVQCETCHGPLALEDRTFLGYNEHREAAIVSLAAENCGACHEGSHHPTFSDWQQSLHAVAKTTSIPGGAFDFIASNSGCAGCHTAEGFLQFLEQDGWEPEVDAPGLEGHDITCATCHDPHSHELDGQLRLPKDQICAKCHNPEYNPDQVGEPDGSEVHHSTAFMFEGKGGYEYEGYDYQSSAHTNVVSDKCVECHVYMLEFQEGPPEVPAYTGHSFNPIGEACVQCHSDFDPESESFDYRGVQSRIDSLAMALEGKLGAASSADSTTTEFYRAKFNYDFVVADGSHGIHNTKYAFDLLTSSIESFTPTGVEEKIDTTVPQAFALAQNYPNPFNPTTIISYTLPSSKKVILTIYNVLGERIRTLVDDVETAGAHKVTWDGLDESGRKVSAGTYIYRLQTNEFTQTRKMAFVK